MLSNLFCRFIVREARALGVDWHNTFVTESTGFWAKQQPTPFLTAYLGQRPTLTHSVNSWCKYFCEKEIIFNLSQSQDLNLRLESLVNEGEYFYNAQKLGIIWIYKIVGWDKCLLICTIWQFWRTLQIHSLKLTLD